ncbi:hypothetical protein SLEP1_g13219 [Rubroshorea leprosula]|uniref:Integrase catalytic domain-containing protein n=1 Tax=Rubroshorea leprosula TaxID=152421 RepID=A0AAV5IRI9_9ROSI|nr:hypothetical protein SLEP1_g13219 [Rubroshorea leprosula]
MFPPVDHAEGGDENQPHASAHNSTSTANQDVVTAQLAAIQQQFGVFQLVLAQFLARSNPGDPLINLLNPTQQPPAPQQNPQLVQHAPAISESQGQSHIAPAQQHIPDDVTRRLDSLEKLVAEHRGAPPQHHAVDYIPHPLNTNITLEPYLAGFKIPQLETYDGTKDPDDHLHAFYSCNARTWYYSLPPRSISSYTEMASAFATKFSSRGLIRKTTSELMRVKQRDGESLKNYMSRFNDAVLEVSSFDQAVGIAAVISGLKHDRFRDNLIKHAATTFSEVNDRSLKFITAEEYAMAQNPTPTKNQNPESQTFMQIKNKMDLRRPSPMRTAAASRDHTRYCDFHQDHGHTTEQCNSLKSELESLAQKGMLNEYVQRAEQPRFVREQRPQPQGVRNPPNRQGVGYQQALPLLPPPARIIYMITGGLKAGGLSSKQRKLYVREVKHQNRAQKRKLDDAEWKNQPITFTSADLDTVVTPHNDPLVTTVMINNCEVQRVLIDTGSAPDIMYFHCFESLGLDPALLQKYDGPIYGFNNQPVPVEGILTLHVAFGSGRTYVTPSVRFLVVKMVSSFNIVIGRLTLTEIRAVVSQSHLCMKFPTPMGIATLRGNQEVARHYDETRAAPVEDVEEVLIDDRDTSRKTQIGTRLNPKERAELIAFLRANNDVFAWTSADMPGIPKSVSQHKLSTNPLKKPVAQKRRLFGGERLHAIKEEVEKLLQAGFVRKVDYCEWVANPILDCYPMPSIDKLVEAASANERLSLLDAYSGYHQVPMAPEDEEKTAFYAGDEIYCYVMMPFGLKNACATYQKMVTIVFHAQIGKNLEVYVDDIVIKSLKAEDHLVDLDETFNNLRKNRMRLNPAKCIFGVESEKFLGFMVSRRGIEVNPEKIRAIAEMEPSKSVKDTQRLTGRVAALHRFISKSADKFVDPVMVKYVALVAELKCKFQKFDLSKIPRAENEQADSLSKFASDSSLSSRFVFVEILDEPSFMKPRVMEISTNPDTPSWIDSIASFLRDGIVPEDRQEAMKLRKKASRYTLVDGVLYKRSFSLPLLRCLNPYEAEYALREVHEGVCGSQVSARTLAHKVLRQGYYWPNMYRDATHFVQKCPKCQFFTHLTHQSVEELTNLVAPWPFAQWGLDLLGPFVKGVGGVTHLVVSVDYFTKWVEARPLSSLTSKKVKDFVFSLIICRYGIPNQIVADNGTQFNCSSFRDFCSSYGIKLQFTSVYHPESNGMVESVNKCVLEGIKPKLEQHKAKWADELNNVLWAYRTTSRTATGETPYHLAFGTEAVIPVEIGVPSLRVTHFDEGRNGQLFRENLDLLAEVREEARLRTLVYKQKLANFYNKRVRPRTFKIGDLVLRKAGLTGFETRFGKLAPNWEGPYAVTEVPHPGASILQDVEGKRVPRVWNVNNLKKFYP